MNSYNLTKDQKGLLKIIIDHKKSGSLSEPIIPGCTHSGCQIMGIDKKFDRNLYGDLDALCDADLLGVRINNQGNNIYTIKEAAYGAIKNNFIKPEQKSPANINIGAIIHNMEGGSLQAVGYSDHSQIEQIVNDPDLLQDHVKGLTSDLLDSVKSEISGDLLVSYVSSVEELKQEITLEKPSASKFQNLFKTLSFLGDIEGSISLAKRAWPYLYPLLVIASERIF